MPRQTTGGTQFSQPRADCARPRWLLGLTSLTPIVSVLLASWGFSAGEWPAPRPAAAQEGTAPLTSPAPAASRRSDTPGQHASQGNQTTPDAAGAPKLEDFEERRGPFSFAGQSFAAILRYKRLPGDRSADSQALASLEIRDATEAVQYQRSFPHAVENGAFVETCSADIRVLAGSNGSGLLIDSGCLPSAPLGGGPWQIVGLVGRKLKPFGKPLVTDGKLGKLVPGAIDHVGDVTQILPDVLEIRVWTGYFFVPVPVHVHWLEAKLTLALRCMYQTGHGVAEEGCEMPAEEAELAPRQQEMTFVRLFRESNERTGPPAHVVVKKDSKVEIRAGKVLITWEEGPEVVRLAVGEDVWVKVRIDGKEGWIHTPEDLNAVGLFASG
jgi:hypothetical protein